MSLISSLASQLRRDEGLVLHAYEDPLGFLTIGYGRMIDIRKGGGITPAEAEFLLSNDIDARLPILKREIPFWDALSEPRQGVLLNMSFQLGIPHLLGFRRMLRHMRLKEWELAAEQMRNSDWYFQTPNRAKRLEKQLLTNTWT